MAKNKPKNKKSSDSRPVLTPSDVPSQRGVTAGLHLQQTQTSFQSTMPIPPEWLERYDAGGAGRGERVFAMLEKEQTHRHDVSEKMLAHNRHALDSQVAQQYIAQSLAAIVTFFFLGATGYLIYQGQYWASLGAAVTPLTALIQVILLNGRGDRPDGAKSG